MLANVHFTVTNVLGGIAILLNAFVLWYYVLYYRHAARLRNTGGARAARLANNPFSAAWIIMKMAKSHGEHRLLDFFDDMVKHAKPGTGDCAELQLQPNQRFIVTRDPEHIKTVLTTKFSSFGKGKQFHDLWHPFLGDSIFTTDGALWHDSRSMIRPMFIKDRISDLDTFERWTQKLVSKMPAGEAVDVMDLFYRMTLDVTTDFLLGASVNSLDNPRAEFAEAFNAVQSAYMLLTMLGPFEALVPRAKVNRGIATLNRFVMPYIEQALALPRDELDKLSSSDKTFTFLHSVAAHTRDPQVLRDQIVAVLLAGRDTTAATLSWAFFELAHYPDKYRRLRDETVALLGRTRRPSYDDLKALTYLRHVLNETLRLYPAVPFNIRAALEDTTLPGSGAGGSPGVGVVAGDMVTYSTMAMQRCADYYPPVSETFAHPSLFSPERWEHWRPKHWQYVPFNGGPRICVGQNFAITEMAYVFVRMLQKYERIEYVGDWHAQQHVAEVVGRPADGVKIRLYEETVKFAGDKTALPVR